MYENDDMNNNSSYTYEEMQDEVTSRTLGIIGLICGILSLICCCFTWLEFVFAIAAIVLGIISLKKGQAGKTMAIIGIVCGSIGVAISVVLIVLVGLASSIGHLFEKSTYIIDEFF